MHWLLIVSIHSYGNAIFTDISPFGMEQECLSARAAFISYAEGPGRIAREVQPDDVACVEIDRLDRNNLGDG